MNFKISKKAWAFAFAYLSMFALGLADNVRGPLFSDLLTHFNLNNWQGSMTFALASTASLVGNISSASIFKKFDLSQALSGSLISMGAGFFLMAMASDFNSYILGAMIFGFGLGLVGVTQTLLINENIEPEHQSKAMSGMQGVYGLSSFIAPLVAAEAPKIFGPWRAGFFVVAGVSLFFGLCSIILEAKPKFVVHQILEDQPKEKKSFLSLFIVGGIFAFYVMAEIMISSRLALYMRTYFEMDLDNSSRYVTYFFVFILMGRLIFAMKAFRYSLRQQLTTSLSLAIVFLILGLKVHPFFLVLTGLIMAPYYPLAITYIAETTGIFKRQFLTFAFSFQSVCVITMHLSVGYLTDQFGLINAFGVGIISLVLALVCLNFHPKISVN